MNSEKYDNLLNLALDTDDEERERSNELNVGYNNTDKTWQVIVKYHGSLAGLERYNIKIEELLSGYAILTVPESIMSVLYETPEIEFVEKPRRLYQEINEAKAASCINALQAGASGRMPALSGAGVLIGIIDSGIDIYNSNFRNVDGTTRIRRLWDQNEDRVYTGEELNEIINTSTVSFPEYIPAADISGHGTAVAGIAAGNTEGTYRGIAYESELLVVKLGVADPDGFPKTTELMRALNVIVKKALELNRPIAVNVSFGNTYGAHDGSGILETYIDELSDIGKTVIIAGSGNEGAAAGHISGIMRVANESITELSVGPYETGFGLQLWKQYWDNADIVIVAPDGTKYGPLDRVREKQKFIYRSTNLLVYYGEPKPYSSNQEIYFDFVPGVQYINSGIWKIILIPREIKNGRYDYWLPSKAVLNSTLFLNADPDISLTIPSTAKSVITAGAYDSKTNTYADFSGRGYTTDYNIKPDIAAPGVNITAPKPGGGYASVSGTSFSAPIVTGSAALMMEWGIVMGYDRYMYGEKLKAYLINGAKQLPGLDTPNPMTGWGALCLRDSLPI